MLELETYQTSTPSPAIHAYVYKIMDYGDWRILELAGLMKMDTGSN